jgi:hypothetical protein
VQPYSDRNKFDRRSNDANDLEIGPPRIVTYHRHEAGSSISPLVAGTTLAGTEAAADFVLDDNRLVPWLHKAEARGEFRSFDILVRGRNLGGTAPRAEVVSFHLQR